MAERSYNTGEEFLTMVELEIFSNSKHTIIPAKTKFVILDKEDDETSYHVYFYGYGSEEADWHRFTGDEIDDFRSSTMEEY